MKKYVLIAVVFQILILLSMLFFAYAPLHFGTKIKLQATGYDPRDLLLGNYTNLRYIGINQIVTKEEFKNNEPIYLSLEQNGSFFVGKTLSKNKPFKGVYLTGRVNYTSKYKDGYHNRLIFGIEKYYSTAKNSQNLEKKLRDKKAIVIVGVLNGMARIEDIKIQ